ncbi:MAG: 30S ribosomal protein S8 [Candidatus Edwardsbacteria bacterium RIFOXYD12_FULL_50_11]|jgi:small subunit ribosomal protein S8|uniref:Small ribosomal subunit protein uS8 n=1 Tax=Candidatus Edwardsbacteria bacterium GWF2_54_11 TaxID=1817851 RepID=A0A1F5RIJ3_9BACT|nr:ribosomal protein S8 [uncultured bacterium]OGF04635.1 MAG: 30S ribosomal protein S8 [Candidatus Edwardsbacteria bacterium RifOxyC12_full_54_24]OGF06024.1 MAG: 30S ribosomal protein S8 [Candidatus Edwardsbacteria bacterium RifOxyA12_full_54_48]OGF11832.1 MAG: 30S ribosomal protein S8 [Candidatus Edwardsbacteria bacterium GWE2_54_12]OGF14256.1 MAG: 30S ribosomal protein S8 [Candidatus Edwardsbacteria bacterium GWF2_54_11]OGF16560.1 MAG: 30S ribosomal protein S8 [Candidatus Edwardsbacteria bac
MSMTDPIADMLTRIRNAGKAKLKKVDIPSSKMKLGITKILMKERLISNFKYITDNRQNIIRVYIRYDDKGSHFIKGLKRVSTPGLRVYAPGDKVPKVKSGTGLAIISTSQGLMKDKDARKSGVGGEVVCYIW